MTDTTKSPASRARYNGMRAARRRFLSGKFPWTALAYTVMPSQIAADDRPEGNARRMAFCHTWIALRAARRAAIERGFGNYPALAGAPPVRGDGFVMHV